MNFIVRQYSPQSSNSVLTHGYVPHSQHQLIRLFANVNSKFTLQNILLIIYRIFGNFHM